MSSDRLMNYAVISLFRIALDCRAALTSNSEHARKEVKNSVYARKEVKNSEHAMVNSEEHRACDGEN